MRPNKSVRRSEEYRRSRGETQAEEGVDQGDRLVRRTGGNRQERDDACQLNVRRKLEREIRTRCRRCAVFHRHHREIAHSARTHEFERVVEQFASEAGRIANDRQETLRWAARRATATWRELLNRYMASGKEKH